MLIFVFDVTSKDVVGDLAHYKSCIDALTELSTQAKIFCLIHKMDLISENERDSVFKERMDNILSYTAPEFKSKT